jgi:hypothetical protein
VKLNLSAEQKLKLAAAEAACRKDCTEANQAKFMNAAKEILSADQLAQLKAECDKAQHRPKTQS